MEGRASYHTGTGIELYGELGGSSARARQIQTRRHSKSVIFWRASPSNSQQLHFTMSSSTKVAPLFTAAAAAASSDPLIVELRKENAALKMENAELKKENVALKTTKKRKAADSGASSEPSKKAKTPAQRKKTF